MLTRRSRLFCASVTLVLLASLAGLGHYHGHGWVSAWYKIDSRYRHNLLDAHSPGWAKDLLFKLDEDAFSWRTKNVAPPTYVPALLEAKWMGEWSVPQLAKPQNCTEVTSPRTPDTPALLMLHFFSVARPGAKSKRDLLRELSPLKSVPPTLRHLVEVKFVLGRSVDVETERQLDLEQAEFGDLIRLDGLIDGDNMDKGKSMNWIRWVGRPGGREAQWVMKCDDDALPFIPNFLPFLLRHDASKPTYIGTMMWGDMTLAPYMGGMFYGFSWGVVKTIAAADLPHDVINKEWYEDARVGELMYSLPSMPGQPHDPIPQEWTAAHPPSPDPRTGLIRLDAGARMTNIWTWFGAPSHLAYVWHGLKSDEDYESTYRLAVEEFGKKGRKFEWSPPSWLYKYAIEC